MVETFPAQKGGRAAPSIALAVVTAHKSDAKVTMKARKSQYRQQGVYSLPRAFPAAGLGLQDRDHK